MNEHDWLLIGSRIDRFNNTEMRVFEFRCKCCNEEDDAFTFDGPPTKRHMMDTCKRDIVP